MADNRRSISGKILDFLGSPLPAKINAVELAYHRLKAIVYYRHVFGSFGEGSVLCRPRRLLNPTSMRVGDRTSIGALAHIELISEYAGVRFSPKVEIGNDVYIGPNLYMVCVGTMTIGHGSVLSEYVYLHDSNHGFDPKGGRIMQQPLVHGGDITIGRDCFLGFRAAILPGVTLGDHCVVATGAVVTKSFPAYSMVAGVPATLIKRWSSSEEKWIRAD
jgi:acetyltransferase-like isoleucine patch superfamily enzyme